MKTNLTSDLKYLIWDIEDREDLPQEDIDLLWRVHNVLRMHDKEEHFCDQCCCPLPDPSDRCAVSCLPRDIASANRGESAVLCRDCLYNLGEQLDSDADPNTGSPYGEIS